MKNFVFVVFTSKHKSCLINTSKRDAYKKTSQRSLKIRLKTHRPTLKRD